MHQNLLSVSLVIRHRAMLIFWRAYEQNSSQRPDETLWIGRRQRQWSLLPFPL